MQYYKEDKMFVLQYITATDGLKISYHIAVDLKQCSNSTFKRKAQWQPINDTESLLGPPELQHYMQEKEEKDKGKCKPDNTEEKTTEGS